MRILYYSPHPQLNLSAPTGYGRHIRENIAAFRKAGHEVIPVIMGGLTKDELQVPAKNGSPVKRVVKALMPGFLWRTLKEWKLLRFDKHCLQVVSEAIEKHKPDLVYERLAWLQSSGSVAAKKYGIKHIVEVNAPYEEEVTSFDGARSLYEKRGRAILQSVFSNAHRIITVSQALGDYLIKRYRADSRKVMVTPNAVNVDEFVADESIRNEVRGTYGLSGHRVIGFVGSIFPYHGVDTLITAFAAFRKAGHPDWKLMIVGDGYLIPALKEQAAQLQCAEHVVFTGPVPSQQVASYISAMDICVQAKCNWYSSPVKIFEYGGMGKPVIAPDTGPVNEVMDRERDGYIVISDPPQIAAAFSKVAGDYPDAVARGKHFQDKVLKQYTWNNVVEKILS
jgi:glycosyltransferase involved in cell wall biosynthesis